MKICPECYNKPYSDKDTNCDKCGGPLQAVPQKSKSTGKKSLFAKQEAPVLPTTIAAAEGQNPQDVPPETPTAQAPSGKKGKKEKKPKKEKGGKKGKTPEPPPLVPQRSGMFQNNPVADGSVEETPVVAPMETAETPVTTAETTAGETVPAPEGSIFRKRVPPPPPPPPAKKSFFSKKK